MSSDARDTWGRTSLHRAVLAGDAAVAAQLLGASPELALAADDSCATALHLAARHPDTGVASPELAALILSSGAPSLRQLVGQRDHKGRTALHFAASAASLEVLELLLEAAPDPGQLAAAADSPDGWLAIHYAAAGGHRAGVACLAQAAPATAAAGLTNGRTPLHLAAYYGHALVGGQGSRCERGSCSRCS